MTARSSGRVGRAVATHAAAFDIADYVKTSRRAQRLPDTVNDPAVLERLISLLHRAHLDPQK